MLAADVAAAAQVIIDGGWGDRTAFFDWAVDHPTCYPLVADAGGGASSGPVSPPRMGVLAGSARSSSRSTSGGTGSERRCRQPWSTSSRRRGCSTQVLIATDEGRPIYERLGFSVQTRYVRMVAPDGEPPPDDVAVRRYESRDLDAIVKLDRMATGEDRSTILRAFAEQETSRVVERGDGTVGGFIVRAPFGGRALIASEPELALALLNWRRRTTADRQIQIAMLQENHCRSRAARRGGLDEQLGGPRFDPRAPLDVAARMIYGQFGGTRLRRRRRRSSDRRDHVPRREVEAQLGRRAYQLS